MAALALGSNVRADGLLLINYTDGGANVGQGQIDVQNGYAVSGYFDVTAGLAAGNYTLYTAGGTGTYQNLISSPSGKFIYDNAVYLAGNPQYPTTNPYLDLGGLLFTDASQNELNLWGNADGTYSFDAYINNGYLNPTGVIGGSTPMPAPEPAGVAVLAFLSLPVLALLRSTLGVRG